MLTRKVQLAFGSAILTLLVVGAVSYRGMVVSRESDRWVRHTHEVIENLQDLLLAMERIESSYRGFALRGKESYLEAYHASLLSAEQYTNAFPPARVWSFRAGRSNLRQRRSTSPRWFRGSE